MNEYILYGCVLTRADPYSSAWTKEMNDVPRAEKHSLAADRGIAEVNGAGVALSRLSALGADHL